jgi:hypothetical protein
MRRRRRSKHLEEVVTRECTSVHILRTEEELEAAIRRASEFDRRAAAVLENRFRHYRALATPAEAGSLPSLHALAEH